MVFSGLAWLIACGTPDAEVEPPTPAPEEEPAPRDLTWVPGRDAAGRFAIDWPAEPGGTEAVARQLDEAEVTMFHTSVATTERPLVKASVGWVLVERGDRSDDEWLAAGVAMAKGPEETTATTVGGLPARRWESSNWSTQFSSAVVLGPDRLWVVRSSNVDKERLEAVHSRVFDSFRGLGPDELTPQEVGATQAFVAMVAGQAAAEEQRRVAAAEAEAAKEAAIAAGERPSDEVLVREHATRQALGMLCVTDGDPTATLRLSVSGGKVTNARVFEVIHSFSNNQPKPRERDDLLSSCVLRYARNWTFPEELSASGVEIPLIFSAF